MNLIDELADKINTIPNLVMPIKKGFLGPNESFAIYPLPGSRTTREYYDGTKDMIIIYEIGMKSVDTQAVNETLWAVSTFLDGLEEVESSDGSFEFDNIIVSNEPYLNQVDDKNYAVFLLTINVSVTVHET